MSDHDTARIALVFEEEDSDPELVEQDLTHLLDEVVQLDGAEVDRVAGEAPTGARSGSGIELATALIGLGSGGASLPMLLTLAQDWLRRRRSGSIRLKIGSDEITISHVDAAVQKRLIDEFLRRHGA